MFRRLHPHTKSSRSPFTLCVRRALAGFDARRRSGTGMAARARRTTTATGRHSSTQASAQELGGAARAQGTRRGCVDTAREKNGANSAGIEHVSEQLILFQLTSRSGSRARRRGGLASRLRSLNQVCCGALIRHRAGFIHFFTVARLSLPQPHFSRRKRRRPSQTFSQAPFASVPASPGAPAGAGAERHYSTVWSG